MLLYCGKLGKRHLNAEVASAYHNSVTLGDDLVDVVDSRAVFDLCDDAYLLAAVFLEEIFDVDDVLRLGNKACGNIVNVVLDTEKDVCLVGLAEIDAVKRFVRKAHTLTV